MFHEGIIAGLDFTPYAAAVKFAKLFQPLHAVYLPILMAVMDNTSSTLKGRPSLISTGNLLRLTASSLQHAHNALAQYPPRRSRHPPIPHYTPQQSSQGLPSRRCNWCDAIGDT
jgi:hypothetical protein